MFMTNLPKFVNGFHQTPFLDFLVNNVREQFAKVREQGSTTPFLYFLVNTVREQFAKVREHCSPNPPFGHLVIMFVNNLRDREYD
jgi:hypothetical protein